MKQFKGTKGDWRIKDNTGRIFSKEYSVQICSVSRQSSIDSNIDTQRDANAKLIANAPDLLDALEHTLDILYKCDCPPELMETYGNLFMNYNNLIDEIKS